MDCPHCGTENLIGATKCASCGKSMLARPKFGPQGTEAPAEVLAAVPDASVGRGTRSAAIRTPAEDFAALRRGAPQWGPADGCGNGGGNGGGDSGAAPPPASEALEQGLCRICRSPFDRTPGATGDAAAVCQSCRTLAHDVAQMAPNDVQIHPGIDGQPTEGFAQRLGSADLRPKPIRTKKAGLRLGPVTAVAGLVLAVVGLAVVTIARREPDRAAEILGDVRPQEVTVELAPPEAFVARITSTLKIEVRREEARAFGGSTSKALDFRQTTVQLTEAALVREDDEGLVFDMQSEGRIADQQGSAGAEDARDASLYPWLGPHGKVRVLFTASGPLVQLDGEGVTPGRDVPPLAHLGALAPPSRTFRIGDRWKTSLVLPGLVSRHGRLMASSFPAELVYAGRAVRHGYACAAFRIYGQMTRELPKPLDDDYNRTAGKIVGAVWIELTTGVVAGADLELDLHAWKEAGRVEDDLRVQGRLTVERK